MREVRFEPAAQAEIAAAFDWYERRSYGLGGDFLRAVAAAQERIARDADQFPTSRGRFRRVLLRRFPYALHFEVTDAHRVSVLACLHHRQSPQRWPGG
ncbi:MAG: type II toxin-antitoxin system RelE/ParE family toxin [Acidovorax sp.]|uniref:type II toxin-antitoxin system RelE/ParE family toxin n=1 Tax=Acidovorax sp. TaxID=1872122 RepID=UPI0039E393F8